MPKPTRSQAAARRSSCPIATSLDLLGDRWSLVVVRDLLRGCRTYGDLLNAPEGIPTNILADRLRRLEESGVVTRKPYQTNPPRYEYELTVKGRDLKPVLGALGKWAVRHVADVKPDPKLAALLRP